MQNVKYRDLEWLNIKHLGPLEIKKIFRNASARAGPIALLKLESLSV